MLIALRLKTSADTNAWSSVTCDTHYCCPGCAAVRWPPPCAAQGQENTNTTPIVALTSGKVYILFLKRLVLRQ